MLEQSIHHAKIGGSFIENKDQQEIRYFSPGEVMQVVKVIGEDEGISSNDFDLENIYGDFDKEKKHLTCLRVFVKDDFAHARGRGNILYVYTVKGDHGGDVREMRQTTISRLESDISSPNIYSQIDIVARYFHETEEWVIIKNSKEKPVRFRMKLDKLKGSKKLKNFLG